MAADIASLISFVRGVRRMMPVLVLVWLFLRLRVLTQFLGSMLSTGHAHNLLQDLQLA